MNLAPAGARHNGFNLKLPDYRQLSLTNPPTKATVRTQVFESSPVISAEARKYIPGKSSQRFAEMTNRYRGAKQNSFNELPAIDAKMCSNGSQQMSRLKYEVKNF